MPDRTTPFARKAAEELADVHTEVARIDGEFKAIRAQFETLKWMVGINITLSLLLGGGTFGVLWTMAAHGSQDARGASSSERTGSTVRRCRLRRPDVGKEVSSRLWENEHIAALVEGGGRRNEKNGRYDKLKMVLETT